MKKVKKKSEAFFERFGLSEPFVSVDIGAILFRVFRVLDFRGFKESISISRIMTLRCHLPIIPTVHNTRI